MLNCLMDVVKPCTLAIKVRTSEELIWLPRPQVAESGLLVKPYVESYI